MKFKITLLFVLCIITISAKSQQIKEPYLKISGAYKGKAIKHSPDPLVNYRWKTSQANDDLEIYTLNPIHVQSDNKSALAKGYTTSSMKITEDCCLMFDFGRVSAGWLEFDSENMDADIEMSISEFNEPAVFNAGSQHPVKTARPIKYGNTYRLELNDQLYEGVRFGWLDIKNLKKPANISTVRLICQTKPTNYEGNFSCSDTLLTRIWYTGAYTVKLNLLKDHFGAILMERSDRHSWTGDAHTSQAASMVAFGNYDFVKENLLYTSTQYNGIASYSLYWVLSLIDYYNYTGDKDLLNNLLENACKKLDIAYEHYDKNPSRVFYGWDERLGAGFENPDNNETQIAYKMLSIRAWNEFSKTMTYAGHSDLANKYESYAKEKVTELRKNSNWTKGLGVHAASDAINAAFANEKEYETLWMSAFSDRLKRLSYSPFNQYFIIQAMAKMQRYAEALTTIDDCWGGQIRYGGTTFFEVFRPSWNAISEPNDAPINNQCGYTSLTHPWSAGVTKWLTEEILGIKPIEPGFTTFSILPRMSSQITNANGSVPTLYGTISASFDIVSGNCNITVPSKTKGIVGIPKAGGKIEKVRFNNKDIDKTKEDDEYIYYQLTEGNYKISVAYSDNISIKDKKKNEEIIYQLGTDIKEDAEAQGNWKSKYGSKGYVFCNYDGTGGNLIKLPDFVQNVIFYKEGIATWESEPNDKRLLLSNINNNTSRDMGCIMTRDPLACQQTMTIDIPCRKKENYQVALYMVDWDKKERRSAIEIFDLESKEMIKPVHMVRNYENGKYIIYNFDRPVRIRINQVRGPNAVLSGIFFD
ncbi:MAG: alpha-L-rhamnosidase C-terminal domain-containing protein [Dysgonomonas sp.]